jgi:hypothetical protein
MEKENTLNCFRYITIKYEMLSVQEKRRLSVNLNENITDCMKSTVTVRGSSVISSQNPGVIQNTALEFLS